MRKHQHPTVNEITEGVIWKQLLLFFFPIMLGTFFQQLYNTVDAIIVGQFVGKEALAAVGGATGTLINLLVGFFVGLSSGATVIISQYYGARKVEQSSDAVHTAVAMSLIGGAIMMVIGIFGAPVALRAMGTPENIMNYSLIYMIVYFVGLIPNLLYNVGSGILRAVGDSKRPMYFLIVCCLANVVLDLLFVLVFQWGVFGAAAATCMAQFISGGLVYLSLSQAEDDRYRLIRKRIRLHGELLKEIVVIGIPAGLQSVMYSVSNIVIQASVNTFGTDTIVIGIPAGLQSVMYSVSNIVIQASVNTFGTDTIAAYTAYGKIDGIFWMIMGAFGVAITTFVGQNFGARKINRIHKSVKVCLAMALGTAVGMSVILMGTSRWIYRLFTQDAAVIEVGMQMLLYLAPYYFTYVCIEVLSGAVRGTGDSIIPMIMTCMGVCVLRVVWIWIAVPLNPTIENVLFSYPLTWSLTSVLFVLYYLQGGWLKRRLKKEESKGVRD